MIDDDLIDKINSGDCDLDEIFRETERRAAESSERSRAKLDASVAKLLKKMDDGLAELNNPHRHALIIAEWLAEQAKKRLDEFGTRPS